MIELINIPPNGTTLEMRLTTGGTFMMFPPIIKMGSYLIWIENVSDTDQEFIVYLLEKTPVFFRYGSRFHETVGRHGTIRKPI